MRTALLLAVLALTQASLATIERVKKGDPPPAPKVDFDSPKAVVDSIPENLYPPKKGEPFNVAGFDAVDAWFRKNLADRSIRWETSTRFMSRHGEDYITVRGDNVIRRGLEHAVEYAFVFPGRFREELGKIDVTDKLIVRGKVILAETDLQHTQDGNTRPVFLLRVEIESIESIKPEKKKP